MVAKPFCGWDLMSRGQSSFETTVSSSTRSGRLTHSLSETKLLVFRPCSLGLPISVNSTTKPSTCSMTKPVCHCWLLPVQHYLYPIKSQVPWVSQHCIFFPFAPTWAKATVSFSWNCCISLLGGSGFPPNHTSHCRSTCLSKTQIWLNFSVFIYLFIYYDQLPIAFRMKSPNSLAHFVSPPWSDPCFILSEWYNIKSCVHFCFSISRYGNQALGLWRKQNYIFKMAVWGWG